MTWDPPNELDFGERTGALGGVNNNIDSGLVTSVLGEHNRVRNQSRSTMLPTRLDKLRGIPNPDTLTGADE
jgi:hypothetical protein